MPIPPNIDPALLGRVPMWFGTPVLYRDSSCTVRRDPPRWITYSRPGSVQWNRSPQSCRLLAVGLAPELGQGSGQDTGNMHLGNAEFVGDLVLCAIFEESQVQNAGFHRR